MKMLKENVDKLNVREGGVTSADIYNGITLYHRPKDAVVTVGGKKMTIIDSLFKYGFSREFTNSNGGNMYGAGVYTVYNLRSSNEKATGYGSAIIKVKLLGGYKDFLIFSTELAQKTYGHKYGLSDQIRYLFPEKADKILQELDERGLLIMHSDKDRQSAMRKSSQSAYAIVRMLNERYINDTKCRGYVYNGGHDGACCFIRDFQSAVPVAVSYDNGRTWKNRLTDELVDRINNETDTHFQLASNFAKVADKSVNGYTLVWNSNHQINYVPSNSNKPISDVWFDDGFNFNKAASGLLYANVQYGDYDLYLAYEDGTYKIYDTDWDYQCELNELPALANGEEEQ